MPLNLCLQIFYSHGKTWSPNLRVLQPQLWDSNVGMTIVHLQIFTSHHRPTQATPSVPTSTHCDSLFTLKTPLPSCRPWKSPSDLKLVRLAFIEPTYIYIYIYMFSLALIWCHKLPLSQSLRTNLRSISKINWKQGSMHCHVQHAPSVCVLYYGHVFTNLVSCASIHPSWFVRPVASTVPCVKFEVSHVSPTNVSSDVNIVPR